jgi:glycosyltransferase involved in cell wall biosynthesis
MPELISVIVATFNREDALDAVLRSLAGQEDRDFEVIVADDGSGPATRQLVQAWEARLGVRLIHVWHENRGFRLAEIRNRAILGCRGTLCIFIDGDCLARPNFVSVHRRLAEPGWFVAGNRVLLGRKLTERILTERLRAEAWPFVAWVGTRRRGEINRLMPLISVPLGPLRKLDGRNWRRARGTNLAIRREDLLRVNGFDSAYSGWGREDSDLVVRLIRSRIRCKDGRFASGVLHLWHPENDRSQMRRNDQRLRHVIGSDRMLATRGLSELTGVSTVAPPLKHGAGAEGIGG